MIGFAIGVFVASAVGAWLWLKAADVREFMDDMPDIKSRRL